MYSEDITLPGVYRAGSALARLYDTGMDTVSLAGPLAAKLSAMRAEGFGQVMLKASDLVGHPGSVDAAVAEIRASGLRCTGLQVLRNFEGISGVFRRFKTGIAQSMLAMCAKLGSPVLLACSSTSCQASGNPRVIVRDLRHLAALAEARGIKVAYEALSWGHTVRDIRRAWELVAEADCPNLGLGLDSFHFLATNTDLATLATMNPSKIFLVQLSDFLWPELPSLNERIATARHYRVFPGEGAHGTQLAQFIAALVEMGYTGDYSFEVCNDDYLQLPAPAVAERARLSVRWLAAQAGLAGNKRSLTLARAA
jgi:sugar phosphate isomerase/epimerase